MKLLDFIMSKDNEDNQNGKIGNTVNKIKLVIVAVAIFAIIFSVYNWFSKSKPVVNQPFWAQVMEEMKLNTITYTYTDAIILSEPEEWKLFNLIDIDPGVRFLAVQYNGIIRLGVDLKKDEDGNGGIRLSKGGKDEADRDIVKMKLPEVIEISHEQFRNEEVTIFQEGKYTKSEVSRELLNQTYQERKAHFSIYAREIGLYAQAKESAQSQITDTLMGIPGFNDMYVIKWE
jgi:hypothetical protein